MFPIKPLSYDRGYELKVDVTFRGRPVCKRSTYKLRTYENILSIYNLVGKGNCYHLYPGRHSPWKEDQEWYA